MARNQIKAWSAIQACAVITMVALGLVMPTAAAEGAAPQVSSDLVKQVTAQLGANKVGKYDLADIKSFADVLAIAMVTAKEAQIADYNLLEALAGLEGVNARLRPQLSLDGSFKTENAINNSYASSAIRAGAISADSNLRTYSGSLTWAQQLGANNQLQGAQETAQIAAQIAAMQKTKVAANVIGSVQSGYFAMADAYDRLQTAIRAKKIAEERLRVAQAKQADGAATALHVLNARNALLQAQNQADMAAMSFEVAVLGILQTIGLDGSYLEQGMDWAADFLNAQEFGPVMWDIDFDTAFAYAIANRADLQIASMQVQLAEVGYQIAVGARDWKVTAAGQYSPNDDTVLIGSVDSEKTMLLTVAGNRLSGLPDSGAGAGDASPNPWQLTMGVTWQFGDGGAAKADIAAKKVAWEKAKTQLAGAKDGVRLELYSLWRQLGQAWQSFQLASQSETAAKETYDQIMTLYELGSATAQDLQDADLAHRQAVNQTLAAARNYEASKTRLAIAIGVPTPELVAAVGAGNWDKVNIQP